MRGIYKITNRINGKCYIGKSENLARRIRYHVLSLQTGKNKNTHMQNAYSKYGKKSFAIEIIETLSPEDDIDERERFWIKTYKSYLSDYGYNRTLGGDGGNSYVEFLSDDEREQLLHRHSENMKGTNNPLYHKHCYTNGLVIKYLSDDEIPKYEQNGWFKGVPTFVREKEKISNLGSKNGFYGKKHSSETKLSLSQGRTGENNWNYGRSIYHKDGKQKYLSPHEVEQYEKEGWVKGVAPATKKKISVKNAGRKRAPASNAVKYQYDNQIFSGWRNLQQYLNQNGYPKISEAAILKLASQKPVRGYDELLGAIRRITED